MFGTEFFRDGTYLVLDLGTERETFDGLSRLSQPQRAAHIITLRLLPLVKTFVTAAQNSPGLFGVKLQLFVPVRAFDKGAPPRAIDDMQLYVPKAEAERFARGEMTSQQLVDACMVLANNNRLTVSLVLPDAR
jgi:hypothetical protein